MSTTTSPESSARTPSRRPSSSEAVNKVVVDFWETQRYRPLQGGWSAPYMGTYHYSNVSGKVAVNFNQVQEDKVPLPFGWKWSDKPWRVDTSSHLYGEVDDEGWSYATSMDSIIKQCCDRQLKGERTSLSMVRRRRWIRSRHCVDATALQIEAYRNDWAQNICKKIREVTEFNSRVQEHLEDYHMKWIRSVETVVGATDQMLLEILSILDFLMTKLHAMEAFLVEHGALELMYAHKLRDFSNKWMHAGQANAKRIGGSPSFAAFSGNLQQTKAFQEKLKTSLAVTDAEKDDNKDISDELVTPPPESAGFFHVVSSTNLSIVDKKIKYATLLSEMLPLDVRQLVQEIQEQLTDCTFDGSRLRTELTSSLEAAKAVHGKATKCFDKSILRMIHTKGLILDSLQHIGITYDANKAMPLINPDFLLDEHHGHDDDSFIDTWAHMVYYGQRVIETNSKLLLYHAEAKMLMKKTNQMASIASNMLRSTIKMIVHEHFRVYQESLTMLESLQIDEMVLAQKIGAQSDEELLRNRREGSPEPAEAGEEEATTPTSRQSSDRDSLESSPMYKNLSNNSAVLLPFLPTLSHVARWSHMRFAMWKDDGNDSDANSGIAVIHQNQNNPIRWRFALCVYTYDGFMHLILTEPDKTYAMPNKAEHDVDSKDADTSFHLPEEERSLESYIMKLDEFHIALSVNLTGAKIAPIFIPKDGYRDAFEVKLTSTVAANATFYGKRRNGATVFPSPSSKPLEKYADLSCIDFNKLVFLAHDSISVRDWMRAVACPFSNPRVDPPEVKFPQESLPLPPTPGTTTRKSLTSNSPPQAPQPPHAEI